MINAKKIWGKGFKIQECEVPIEVRQEAKKSFGKLEGGWKNYGEFFIVRIKLPPYTLIYVYNLNRCLISFDWTCKK